GDSKKADSMLRTSQKSITLQGPDRRMERRKVALSEKRPRTADLDRLYPAPSFDNRSWGWTGLASISNSCPCARAVSSRSAVAACPENRRILHSGTDFRT